MDEILNKDVFIGFFITLLVIAVLINLILLLLLLWLFSHRRHDAIGPFHKLVTSCLLLQRDRQGGGRSPVGVGVVVRGKHWVMAACCVSHLLTAGLHHSLLLQLYAARQGYLPPSAPCSTLVLTEISAFIFPTITRLLVAFLVIMEIMTMTRMTSVSSGDVRRTEVMKMKTMTTSVGSGEVIRVTCVLTLVTLGYVCGVLLPVFFCLYLESASEPCYPGESVLRYTSTSSEGRAIPLLSYILPVVVIVVAVVVMIVTYKYLRRQSSSSSTSINGFSSVSSSSATFHNVCLPHNGHGDDEDDTLGNHNGFGNNKRFGNKNRIGNNDRERCYDDIIKTDMRRSVNMGLQYRSGTSTHSEWSGDSGELTTSAASVSFPWDTLAVAVVVVGAEFLFCVRQFAFWDLMDDRLMSTQQWIQLWAADRVISLVSLIAMPLCWFFDPCVRQVLPWPGHASRSPAVTSEQTDGVGRKRDPRPEYVESSRHSETLSGGIHHRTMPNGNGIGIYQLDATPVMGNSGRGSYRQAIAIEFDGTGKMSLREKENDFNQKTSPDHIPTRHGNMTSAEWEGDNPSEQTSRRQYQALPERRKHRAEDTMITCGDYHRTHDESRPEDWQRGTPDWTSESPSGTPLSDYAGRLDSCDDGNQFAADSRENYGRHFSVNTTEASPPRHGTSYYSDRKGLATQSQAEREHKQNNDRPKTEGVYSVQRNGVSAPNVLSSVVTDYKDVFQRHSSYPDMPGERAVGHVIDGDNYSRWDAPLQRNTRTEYNRLRRGDNQTSQGGSTRRNDYRQEQRHDEYFSIYDKKKLKTPNPPSRHGFTTHSGQTEEYPAAHQRKNNSTHTNSVTGTERNNERGTERTPEGHRLGEGQDRTHSHAAWGFDDTDQDSGPHKNQTAFRQKQCPWGHTSSTLTLDKDHIRYQQRSPAGDNEDRFGYNSFANDLNHTIQGYQNISIGYKSHRGHLAYQTFADNQIKGGMGYNNRFPTDQGDLGYGDQGHTGQGRSHDQGHLGYGDRNQAHRGQSSSQGHGQVLYRDQGQDRRGQRRLGGDEERGEGRITFYGDGQRREGDSNNPEYAC